MTGEEEKVIQTGDLVLLLCFEHAILFRRVLGVLDYGTAALGDRRGGSGCDCTTQYRIDMMMTSLLSL